jgi:hypothetical protein
MFTWPETEAYGWAGLFRRALILLGC